MNTYHEKIFKKLIESDLNTHFEEFNGSKENLKELINEFLSKQEIHFEEPEHLYKENKTHKYRDRIKYENKEGKCLFSFKYYNGNFILNQFLLIVK